MLAVVLSLVTYIDGDGDAFGVTLVALLGVHLAEQHDVAE